MNTNYPFIELDFEKRCCSEMIDRSKEYYNFMDKRRTVREISEEPIDDEIIHNLILTAGTAPSGANVQPWKFCHIKDPAVKQQIRDEAEVIEKKSYDELFSDQKKSDIEFTGNDWQKDFLTTAPALIVVFKEKYRYENGEKISNYYPNESVGLALGLLFSAIHNAGLVTIPYTPHPISFLKKILNRPDNEAPVMLLPVGYPIDGAKIPDKKRKLLEEIMETY